MDQLLARISKIPVAQRWLIIAGLAILVLVANYFLVVSSRHDAIAGLDRNIEQLQTKLIQKKKIAQDLQRFRVEVERLKQRLNEALTLLPNEAEIPELLQKIAALVEQSDCEMSNFKPLAEQSAGFYAKIPVSMTISGNYHSIAVFFDKVAKLTRIVNVTDIGLSSPKVQNKKVVLEANFLATTFKFVDRPSGEQASAGTAGKGFK